MCTDFKNSFTSKQNDNSVVQQNRHTLNVKLHYPVIYCYHCIICFILPLFSEINVSQGSVAIFVRCSVTFSELFYYKFTVESAGEKSFENRLAFGEVMNKSIGVSFFPEHGVLPG